MILMSVSRFYMWRGLYIVTSNGNLRLKGPRWQGGGGGGWVLRISSDGDDRMEAKQKPKEIPRDSKKTPQNPWTKT